MNNLITEAKSELEGEIDNLSGLFEDYDFNTIDGLDKSCLKTISGFESLAVDDNSVKRFSIIKKTIKASLFSNDDDHYKVSDFDWDQFEETLEEITEKYATYTELLESVEDNLTGNLTVDTANVLNASDLMSKLLELAVDQNDVYEIMHPVHGVVYVLSSELQAKMN